jgi:hypothetical protein
MEKYLDRVANKPDSTEHRNFLDSNGFRTFSSGFREAMIIMQNDIAGADRRFVKPSARGSAHSSSLQQSQANR